MRKKKEGLTKPIPIRLSEIHHNKLKELSEETDRSVASLVREAVRKFIDEK